MWGVLGSTYVSVSGVLPALLLNKFISSLLWFPSLQTIQKALPHPSQLNSIPTKFMSTSEFDFIWK